MVLAGKLIPYQESYNQIFNLEQFMIGELREFSFVRAKTQLERSPERCLQLKLHLWFKRELLFFSLHWFWFLSNF